MTQVTFADTDFPTILGRDFDGGYNNLGLDDLGDDNIIVKFVGLIASDFVSPDPSDPDVSVDWDHLLLIKADKEGFIERIYTPTIYKDAHDNVVIKCGGNSFNCAVGQHTAKSPKGKDFPIYGFKCGSLVGEISWSDKFTRDTVTRNGEEIEIEYQRGTVQFVDYSDPDLTYYNVPIWFDSNSEPSRSKVEMAIKTDEPITEFLALAPGGGSHGTTYKLQDLISDENGNVNVTLPYRIPLQAGYKIINGQYGESYIVTTQDGKGIWTRGTASAQIATGFEPEHGDLLVVSKAKKYSDGKWNITCGFRKPKAVTTTTKPASAKPATITQTAEATTLF